MQRTLVILAVGLAPRLVGVHTPNLARLAARGAMRPLATVTPAVTCTVQATLMTGLPPSGHGIVANGWYFRDLAEVLLWRQPEGLVAGEKIWEAGRARDAFTCAKMFWWYNMYSSADYSATPRPMYPADGRKIPDHYAYPPELHDELDARFGQFPLFKFWGPLADIASSEWIARATLHVMATRQPTLTLTYLPHLDYNLQRLGPDLANLRLQRDLAEIDALCGELIEAAEREGRRVIVVSEYGITPATDAIHVNRALRAAGLLAVRREEHGRETLDAGASEAFSMADHQIAHIYVRDQARVPEVAALVAGIDGVESVWCEEGKRANGLDHQRSGELVAIAKADRWFSYYYWLDEARAPDFARTVDIHRKPGYDPVELFIDPAIRMPKLTVGWKVAKRKLGFRQLLDVISATDTRLVKGTHGRLVDDPADGPLVISSEPDLLPQGPVAATGFKQLVLDHVFR
jgi:predicted AlkP superfamily pyrophosphatase or phosphodiesterase